MDFIKDIILFASRIFEFIIRIGYILCKFLGDKTVEFIVKIDPSYVNRFNKIFSLNDKTVSTIIGVLELALLLSIIKYMIARARNASYGYKHKPNVNRNRSNDPYNKRYKPNAYSNSRFSGTGIGIDDLTSIQELYSKRHHSSGDYDFNNQLFQQQMLDDMNRELMKQSVDEAMKVITPVDEGGYVQGPYLNPSDTFSYEQQTTFDDNMFNHDYGYSESNNSFDSSNSFHDSGCDSSFNSFNDFGSGGCGF